MTTATTTPAAAGAAAGGLGRLKLLGGRLGQHGDVLFALGVVAIIVVLILPLPAWLLDISLAFSITLSVLILLTALFVEKPLDFNAFPTVLLLATMVRLALNLASTRLILTHGHEGLDAAGAVIAAFGDFVMGGNFIIGVIVFSILMIVNFVVITKGSGRIAEVSARFSLDAMPGKQMAIDADLSAGLINEDQARARRAEIEEESGFFGAMDGAAKFVRGDAIAGLLIMAINIIGGMIIGVAQKGMSFADAAEAFTHLTIGDGLVTQIPALIVSTAAGIIVTKASVSGTAEKALVRQLGNQPKVLGLSAALLVALALLPGIPAIPFLLLAIVVGTIAWFAHKRTAGAAATTAAAAASAAAAPPAEEPIGAMLKLDDIRLELGYGLLSLVGDAGDGPKLTDQIKALRKQLAIELGFVMPSVRIQDNLQLPADAYVLRIKEIEAGRGEVRAQKVLVIDPRGEAITLNGEATREPTFGLPAMWIDAAEREEALFRGYTVVEPATVITTHLTELVKEHMAELLSYAETRKLLDELDREHKRLVEEMVPAHIAYAGVQRVLQNLLAERVSIRDLPTILEGIAEACTATRSITQITEHVRARLARQISDMNANEQGVIPLITLSPQWEQAFAEALVGAGDDKQLALAPSRLQEFIGQLRAAFERQAQAGEMPVLLTSPTVRPYVRSIVERFRPISRVMSQNEIFPRARIRTVAQI
ncbi:MAG: flagellar biosynthesis protein FlhA [Rhodospirillales bacterium]|jgi:flagellar biosynthesis protein FlhA|nr:flagellar biosynthesis protein FlhA [Rhodospirillales bacterium]